MPEDRTGANKSLKLIGAAISGPPFHSGPAAVLPRAGYLKRVQVLDAHEPDVSSFKLKTDLH